MRLLFVADGRSPTTLSWLRYWIEKGHETHLVSTYPCTPMQGLASFHVLPVAFSGMASGGTGNRRGVLSRFKRILRPLRDILGPLSLPLHWRRYRQLVRTIRPDLVHALRIPFEGMLALATPKDVPLTVSIWGNDITLHARASLWMGWLTRRTLRRAAGRADRAAGRPHPVARGWGVRSSRGSSQ